MRHQVGEVLGRRAIATWILERLSEQAGQLKAAFKEPHQIPSFYVDDVLPTSVAKSIHEAFPPVERMVLKRSWRENKYVAVQMDAHDPLLEEAVYAFQDERVVQAISSITGIDRLDPDPNLYAGGVSAMEKGQFLAPHIDNSHDGRQRNYRALNLLYYATPEWDDDDGGGLQLWDKGMHRSPRVLACKFNRLVVMRTDPTALHSVSRIAGDRKRCCVSNYYFTPVSPTGRKYFHATSFRAWPGHPIRDAMLIVDAAARTLLLSTVLKGRYRNPHIYRRGDNAEQCRD